MTIKVTVRSKTEDILNEDFQEAFKDFLETVAKQHSVAFEEPVYEVNKSPETDSGHIMTFEGLPQDEEKKIELAVALKQRFTMYKKMFS